MATNETMPTPVLTSPSSPWLTVREAARYAKCGVRSIYAAVRQGKLQAAHLGGRRELRVLTSWIDAWLLATSAPEPARARPVVDSRAFTR